MLNLAQQVNAAVDESATLLNDELLSNSALRNKLRLSRIQNLALEAAGFASRSSLMHLEETDDNHPRIQLYYANLGILMMKVLARAADQQNY